MAARKVHLKDKSGNKAYPVTSSSCVGMSDGSGSLDKKIAGIISNSGYVACTTAAGTAAKTVTQAGFALSTNCRLIVKMINYNTAASPTLNVNNTGSKPLYYNGEIASADNTWEAGDVLDIYYDGINYQASNIQGGISNDYLSLLGSYDSIGYRSPVKIRKKKGHIDKNGSVVSNNTYSYTEPIYVEEGKIYTIRAKGYNISVISKYDNGLYTPIYYVYNSYYQTLEIQYIYEGDNSYIVLCGLSDSLSIIEGYDISSRINIIEHFASKTIDFFFNTNLLNNPNHVIAQSIDPLESDYNSSIIPVYIIKKYVNNLKLSVTSSSGADGYFGGVIYFDKYFNYIKEDKIEISILDLTLLDDNIYYVALNYKPGVTEVYAKNTEFSVLRALNKVHKASEILDINADEEKIIIRDENIEHGYYINKNGIKTADALCSIAKINVEEGTVLTATLKYGTIMAIISYIDNNIVIPAYTNTINPNNVNTIQYLVERSGTILISFVTDNNLEVYSKKIYLSRDLLCVESNKLVEYSLNDGGIDSSGNKTDANHYFYTTPIYLQKGKKVNVIASGYSMSVISKTNETVTFPTIPLVTTSSVHNASNSYIEKYSYTAEEDMYVTICGYYIISVSIGSTSLKNFILNNTNNDYFNLNLIGNYKTDIIALYKNYVLKDVKEDDSRYFYYSSDCGKTFVKSENKLGDITFVHFFSNKYALICTKTKAYYTTDFSEFNESTIYDYSGSKFVANSSHFWYEGQYLNENIIIDNKEIAVWSDYNIESGYTSRIWVSYDSGKIVRCILKSGETIDINSNTITVRHFHDAKFDKYRNCIWVTSGDYGNQCLIAKGLFNSQTKTWQWEIINQGDLCKFGQIHVNEKTLLFVTDYTSGKEDTGVIECPIAFLSDINYYNYVYKTDDKSPVVQYFKDNNGNIIITPDGMGYLKFYYAKNNTNLRAVQVISNERLSPLFLIGPNYNGDMAILCCDGYNLSSPSISQFTRYLFSKAMRDSGVLDFCKNCI